MPTSAGSVVLALVAVIAAVGRGRGGGCHGRAIRVRVCHRRRRQAAQAAR